MSVLRDKAASGAGSRMVGAYDFEATIGKGHFAVVKQARHVFTGERVAVKVFDKLRLDASSSVNLLHEIGLMKLVRHPNIVRLYEVIDTQSKIFLVLELGDYDLYDYITKNASSGLPEVRAKRYFSQIVEAIAYCHHLHVVHRDLKPENVVFFAKLDLVKLTDFGLSHLFVPGQLLKTSCGSLAYSAPEILLGNSYDAPAVDIWSLGVILYMLVCGCLPFQGASDSETLTRIMDCAFYLPSHLSVDCNELISKTLVRDPQVRMTLNGILSSGWLESTDRSLADGWPLIRCNEIPEEIEKNIIDQMVNGGIGDADQIYQSLEKDEYNHLTATYFLLAERALKNLHVERCHSIPLASRYGQTEASVPAGERLPDGALLACPTVMTVAQAGEPLWRKRHCSVVNEESEDDSSSLAPSGCSCYLNLSRNSSVVSSRHQSASVLVRSVVVLWRLIVCLFQYSPSSLQVVNFRDLYEANNFCPRCMRRGRSVSFVGSESEFRRLRRNMSFPFFMKIAEEEEEIGGSNCGSLRLPKYRSHDGLSCCHTKSVCRIIAAMALNNNNNNKQVC